MTILFALHVITPDEVIVVAVRLLTAAALEPEIVP